MFKGRYRFAIAAMLFLATAIGYIDRSAIGIVAPLLTPELHLSPSQMGVIFSGFFCGYTAFAFIGGSLADRFGPVRVMSWSMGIWSVLCGLTAVVFSFSSFFILRVFFGMGEGPTLTTINRTAANWFSRREVSTMVGTIFSGQMFGAAIAGPIVGLLALRLGWRVSFVVIAVLGLVWLAVFRRMATNRPADNPRVTSDELQRIEAGREEHELQANDTRTLRQCLISRNTLGVCIGLFAANYTINNLLFWLPTYFVSAQHAGVQQMSLLMAIPWIAGMIGSSGGGLVSDLVYRRMSNPVSARKLCAWVPLALSGLAALLFSTASSLVTAVLLVTAAITFISAAGQAHWVINHELYPRRHVGGVGGFIHLMGNISGIVGPAITGMAVQHFGGFEVAFKLCTAIDAVGVLAMILLVHRPLERVTGLVANPGV